MFCGKCGVECEDNAKFCVRCGANLSGDQVPKYDTPVIEYHNDKNRKVGIIAVTVSVFVVIGIIIALSGGRSYKKTVDEFIDAQFKADAEAALDLIPEKLVDYILEDEGYSRAELDDFIEEGNETLEDQLEYLDEFFGDDWNVSYEIKNVEDVKGERLDELREDYKEFGVKISDAKEIEVEIIIECEDGDETNSLDVSVIKVGRSWYIDVESMELMF